MFSLLVYVFQLQLQKQQQQKNMLNEYNLKWNLLDPVLDFTVTQTL